MNQTRETIAAAVLAALLLVAGIALGGRRSHEEDTRCSTWVDDRQGAHALWFLLEDLGLDPERTTEEPQPGEALETTRVLLAPSWPPGRRGTAALLDWTAGGGRLVLAEAPPVPGGQAHGAPEVLARLGVRCAPSGADELPDLSAPGGKVRAAVDALRWRLRQVLAADPNAKRDERAGTPEDLVTCAAGPVVQRVPFGDGEVVVVSDVSLLTNLRLRDGDNAVLAVELLAGAGRPVVFDEFHHGFGADGDRSGAWKRIGLLLVSTWVGRALLVVALAGIVYVAGAAVRLGAARQPPPPPRRALREHADALGRLFEGARARREVLEILAAGVRRTCARKAGYGAGLGPAAFRRQLERSIAPGARALGDALAEAESGAVDARMRDSELARIAANLAAAKRRFLHGTG